MKYKITLHGTVYEVEVMDGKASIVDEYEATAPVATPVSAPAPATPAPAAAPAPAAVTAAGETVTAPMPGTILKVLCQQGASVKEGDVLVILEAMKMENEILAPRAGTVAQVVVSPSTTVDTGAVLVVLS
ncbi:MAG: biotin/lipoyl-binding protein [Oscillospiraceae bacterium]|nr:biotin/lipoyl-binding protein [Oscillospiraceae bacterium]